MSIDDLAKELFGEMRHLTEEEQEAYNKGLDAISEPTGIQLFDFMEPRKIVRVKGRVTKVSRASGKIEWEAD